MALALVALGSNLGQRAQTLDRAVRELAALVEVRVRAVSSWHAMPPVGGPPGQEEFLNGAVALETSLEPLALWHLMQQIENGAQRVRDVHWGPRTLDLDLLLYETRVLDSPELQIPHPRMVYRRFVLEPAAEIAAAWTHSVLGWSLGHLREHLNKSPRYVACIAGPGTNAAAIAEEAQDTVGGEAVFRGHRDDADPAVSLPFAQVGPADASLALHVARTEITRRLDLLENLAGRSAQVPHTGGLVISDFWAGEPLLDAASDLSFDEFAELAAHWRQASQASAMPRLIVLLVNRPCENAAADEQLNKWLAGAQRVLRAISPSPWIVLDTHDPSAAKTEFVAAVEAMS